MNAKDIMMLYGITLGQRRTKKQKYLFATSLKETCGQLGISFLVYDHKMARYNVENIVVGNLNQSDVVLAIGYDTASKALLKCNYYPFHTSLTISDERKNMVVTNLLAVLSATLAVVGFVLAEGRVLYYIGAVVFALLTLLLIFYHNQPLNFNRNSASVAIGMNVLESLKGKKAAIVFCDQTTKGYDGYRLLLEKITNKQTVIVLDALASGEKLVLAHYKNDETKNLTTDLDVVDKKYKAEQAENNVFSILPNCLYLTSGTITQGELVVENTRSKKDCNVDMDRFENIVKALVRYVEM